MTSAENHEVRSEENNIVFSFPAPDDWKNIVRDLKLTKIQENDLDITIRHVIADIERYQVAKRNAPSRGDLVAALKRLESMLARVQNEMERSKHLMGHFLSNKTLEFIGESFTFTAMEQAVGSDVLSKSLGLEYRDLIEINNSTASAALEERFCGERLALGYKHGAEILRYFIGVIRADLKSWVELDRLNKGGRPADIFRRYIMQRLAERAPVIIGNRATTTANGKFEKLCVAVLPACGFRSNGIEKAIEGVLGRMSGEEAEKRVKRQTSSK